MGQSCGDILYGDYIGATPGSLQGFVAQLRGKVISGPALLQDLARPSSTSLQMPAKERNRILFICANLVALLVSGTVAGVSACYLKDNPTGVAIATAMQMLVISALFLRWTDRRPVIGS